LDGNQGEPLLRQGSGGQVKRKEINLAELRKALEDSLMNKDEEEDKPAQSPIGNEAGK
jgi:hypothetical protein